MTWRVPIFVLVLMSSCSAPRPAVTSAVNLADVHMCRRAELLRGSFDVQYAVAEKLVVPGERIEVKVAITNKGEEVLMVPANLDGFVTLYFQHIPDEAGEIATRDEAANTLINDPGLKMVAALKLRTGAQLKGSVWFDVPDVSPGALRIVPSMRTANTPELMVRLERRYSAVP